MATFLKKNEYDSIIAVSALLEVHEYTFRGKERETVEDFLDMVTNLSERRRQGQIKHAEAIRAYRTNPETREKAQEIDKRAQVKFQAKKKSEK